jgi:putative nucleotidyltransferase-like protein
MTALDAAESSLCAAIRGTPEVWRRLRDPEASSRLLEAAAHHRLRPLLAWHLREQGELGAWPESLRVALVDAERAEAVVEAVRRQELCTLLGAFETGGVPVLLLKGAALAYSLYPEPWLRPREDTDLLIRPDHAERAGAVLTRAGYRPIHMVSGTLVTNQRTFVRVGGLGLRHECDLHWKIANPRPVADLISAEQIIGESVTVALDQACVARVPRPIHALVVACLHRTSHHYDSDNLLWLYDIHLLADGMAVEAGAELVELARRTAFGVMCARGLRLAADRFGTRLPASLVARLDTAAGEEALTSVYLRPGVRKTDLLLADLRALPNWRLRMRLLREHLFPPADYILGCYGRPARWLLPALYAYRIVRGMRGWFRPL